MNSCYFVNIISLIQQTKMVAFKYIQPLKAVPTSSLMRTRTSPGSKCLCAGPSGTCMDTALQFQQQQVTEQHDTTSSTISGMIKEQAQNISSRITTESTTSIPVSPSGETTRTICTESKLWFLSLDHGGQYLKIHSHHTMKKQAQKVVIENKQSQITQSNCEPQTMKEHTCSVSFRRPRRRVSSNPLC